MVRTWGFKEFFLGWRPSSRLAYHSRRRIGLLPSASCPFRVEAVVNIFIEPPVTPSPPFAMTDSGSLYVLSSRMAGRNVEKLLCHSWGLSSWLMHQCFVGGSLDEGVDNVGSVRLVNRLHCRKSTRYSPSGHRLTSVDNR